MLAYRALLLPELKARTTHSQRCEVAALKTHRRDSSNRTRFVRKQPYVGPNEELRLQGYTVVHDVFTNEERLSEIHRMADAQDLNMCEFVDKNHTMRAFVEPLLEDEGFISLYEEMYGSPYLWQKTTLHRKKHTPDSQTARGEFSKNRMTAEHVDLTETPNSALTLTAYVAVSDQNRSSCSKLMVYPGSHLMIERVPLKNFDYVQSDSAHSLLEPLFGEINGIVEEFPELDWVRECLYHLLVLNISEYAILKSTFTLMLFNPSSFEIDPVSVPLNKGDVLFFLSNLLHGSSSHGDPSASRVSLAVRGGYPYYEPSSLISQCVDERFYDTRMKGASTPRGQFLFSGTHQMIEKIEHRNLFDNIIYRIGNTPTKKAFKVNDE